MNRLSSGMLLSALLLVGCSSPQGQGLVDHDASYKIPAMKVAGEEKNQKAVPQLVKDLENDDPAVRFYAIEALKRITGENFGYRYYDDGAERKDSVERWNQWLKANQK